MPLLLKILAAGMMMAGPFTQISSAESMKAMAVEKVKKVKETIAEMRAKCPDLITDASNCRKVDDYKTCLTDIKKRCSKEEEENKASLNDKAAEAKHKISGMFK